jgi:hypothetical protein
MESYRKLRVDESEIGTKYGRLTTIGPWFVIPAGKRQRVKVAVLKCECGRITTARRQDLRRGSRVSCGCKSPEGLAARNRARSTHGQARRRTKDGVSRITPEYMCWAAIIARCKNPKHISFRYYGGRGIEVCERWQNSFEAFFHDVGPRPSNKHSIDRIDVNGNYEPGNVRWATSSEQARNRRKNRRLD